MSKKALFRFNVKNVKYAVQTSAGVWGTPKDLAYATALELTADYEEIKLYGDGRVLAILGDDKGLTGSLSVIDLNETYDTDMKRAMKMAVGLGSIQQRSTVKHAIYFETDGLDNGESITIKTWLFGCTTGKPSESYTQTEDNPTITTYQYPLNVIGTNVKQSGSSDDDYVDEGGNKVFVTKLTVFPEDTGFDTFGETVPTPRVPGV